MIVTIYVHGDDDGMWTVGEKLGLTGDVLSMFSHAADEFAITLDVDTVTGLATPIALDGRKIEPKP